MGLHLFVKILIRGRENIGDKVLSFSGLNPENLSPIILHRPRGYFRTRWVFYGSFTVTRFAVRATRDNPWSTLGPLRCPSPYSRRLTRGRREFHWSSRATTLSAGCPLGERFALRWEAQRTAYGWLGRYRRRSANGSYGYWVFSFFKPWRLLVDFDEGVQVDKVASKQKRPRQKETRRDQAA